MMEQRAMEFGDWVTLALFFLVLIAIGIWSFHKVKGSNDFYLASGKIPWWLAGISHHVSGYSGVVFTGYAAIAFQYGFTIWGWWATATSIACFVGAFTIAPRWARLRIKYQVQSPTEYLQRRYGIWTQQLVACSGVLLKMVDVGAKFAAIGILMNGFTGLPIVSGILLTGLIAMLYVTVGGLWADILNDSFQFLIQLVAGTVIFIIIGQQLGGLGLNYLTMWQELPASHTNFYNGPYTFSFAVAITFIAFLSYNGGTWNLALRYLSSPTGTTAKRTALLSGSLYLLWPLIMFAPMWAAPLLINVGDDQLQQIYSIITLRYLPTGLVGLVLASMFAATMSMIASDANAVSSVISRDVLPFLMRKSRQVSLKHARIATFSFTAITLLIAINNDSFGGVIGLIISWFSALVGPAAIPMIFGLLPGFQYSDNTAAIGSILAGFATFIVMKIGNFADIPISVSTGLPTLIALLIYTTVGIVNRQKGKINPEAAEMVAALNSDRVLTKETLVG